MRTAEHTRGWLRRTTTCALMAPIALWVGCASGPRDDGDHPVFPPPPARARVVHRANVSQGADLAQPGALQRMLRAVAGRPRHRLAQPVAVAADGARRLYVADMQQQAVVHFDTRNGRTRLIQRAGATYLVSPVGLAIMGDSVAVADSVLARVFVFDQRQRLKGEIEGLERPTGLHYDAHRRRLFVVDTLAHQVLIYDADLNLQRRLGEPGPGPGQFNFPTQVFVDREGYVYVTDSMNFRVQVLDPQGRYLTHIGQVGDASGYLTVPKGVAVDSFGHIYVADTNFSNIQVYDRTGRFLLVIGRPGSASGEFHLPVGMAMDAQDRLYVADSFNHRIQIFQYIGGPTDAQP